MKYEKNTVLIRFLVKIEKLCNVSPKEWSSCSERYVNSQKNSPNFLANVLGLWLNTLGPITVNRLEEPSIWDCGDGEGHEYYFPAHPKELRYSLASYVGLEHHIAIADPKTMPCIHVKDTCSHLLVSFMRQVGGRNCFTIASPKLWISNPCSYINSSTEDPFFGLKWSSARWFLWFIFTFFHFASCHCICGFQLVLVCSFSGEDSGRVFLVWSCVGCCCFSRFLWSWVWLFGLSCFLAVLVLLYLF